MNYLNNKILIWAPYRGNVGTIDAVINYADMFRDGGYHPIFVEVCDEWSSIQNIKENYEIISLTQNRILKNIGKTNLLKRRDFFLYCFFRLFKLKQVIFEINPKFIFGFLGLAQLLIASKDSNYPVFGSIQGYPRFLNSKIKKNFYIKTEDNIRKFVWKKTYSRLQSICCMTPSTAEKISHFLKKPATFVPNPLFAGIPETTQIFSAEKPLDYVLIGRFSYQKRFDAGLSFFRKVKLLQPSSKLHIFGDATSKDIQSLNILTDSEVDEAIILHGFRKDLWSYMNTNLNAVHLVASEWEDPGHAILEGLNHKVPTLFINVEANYMDFYNGYKVCVFNYMNNISFDEINDLIRVASEPKGTRRIQKNLCSKFYKSNVYKIVDSLIDV